ncbi:MAG: N-6 DNA methylase [Dehalococcoidales bacterium]|nr:N-6 DNA methylase [Dehalococcoidales bacterium]
MATASGTTLSDFVARWRASTLAERAGSQSHFIELCQVLGQPVPSSDPTGDYYTFEKGLTKVGGSDGWADVWKRGHFAWEYKGKHKDLVEAYRQLLQYKDDLENPPLLVVCDMDRFEVHTNFTNTAKRVYAFTLLDLLNTTPLAWTSLTALDVLRAVFAEPERLRPERTTAQVTEEAATEFAKLSASLRQAGADPEGAARFLMRLLFCLFAEDVGLLPDYVFSRLVEHTKTRPEEFKKRLGLLFEAMAEGGSFGYDDILHFDGGLFADAAVLDLRKEDLAVLSRASSLDWASVEPAIFGTLFERSLDPGKRGQLGAHYTSKEDILLVVHPVLMAPLRREWAKVRQEVQDTLAKRDAAKGKARARHQEAAQKTLLAFASRIAEVRVLDPACGSGNFLYVALRQLMDLEKEIITFAANNGLQTFFPQVEPKQLYGIEVNPYAHELAQVVVWIGYIQCLRDNGYDYEHDPILKPLHNIEHRDAILAFDEEGNPVEPEWPEADVIVGNPPFLGGNMIRQGLGDDYLEALFVVYQGRVPRFADLVCYWFEVARKLVGEGRVMRAGLLATQGIRGGANSRVLERIKSTGDIFWAYSDRNWILEGATVHVSMVGFDNGTETSRVLDGLLINNINADLTSGVDLTMARRMTENAGVCFMGPSPKGPFDIPADLAHEMLTAPINVNGRPNSDSDVVRPVASGVDLTGRARGLWTIDFGQMPLDQAAQYELPFKHVLAHVYPVRSKNRRAAYAKRWWQYAEARPGMRQALAGQVRFLATPEVAKHRVFVWVRSDVLCNQQTLVFAREDDYTFGVLQSRPHELWARRLGTQLREAESGCRYTPTTTFETFPFPWPLGQEPMDDPRVKAIAEVARELVEKREAWLNPPGLSEEQKKSLTLTNLYNKRPTWLDLLHRRLDEAVFDAYGWPRDLGDDEILARLLALNLERSAPPDAGSSLAVSSP